MAISNEGSSHLKTSLHFSCSYFDFNGSLAAGGLAALLAVPMYCSSANTTFHYS